MYRFLIIKRRAKKIARLAKLGDQQVLQTRLLLDSRGAELEQKNRRRIEELLLHAEELRAGLDVPRLEQLEQAKLFSDCAEKTLRILEEKLP